MDGQLFPDSTSLRRAINRHTKETLIDLAIRWVTIHAITRVQEDASDEEDYYDEYIMELDERPPSLRTMSIAKYEKHVIKRYELMRDKHSTTKKKVADRMLAVDWRNGFNSSQVAELDLMYYSRHASVKDWKTLKLDYSDSCKLLSLCLLSLQAGSVGMLKRKKRAF